MNAKSPILQKGHIVLYCILILAPVLACLPTVWNDFQYYWDDQWQVMNSYTSSDWTWNNLYTIFSTFNGGQYSPVNQVMYMIIYTFFGYNPAVFHIICLLLHIANVLFIYTLISKLLTFQKSFDAKKIRAIAFLSALLFAIHPVNVESVAWVSASKIPFYAFFYFSGLLSYLRYIETKRTGWYLATLAAFIFSFGCKEQAVTFPICLLLLDWFLHRNLRSEQVWAEKISFFALALFFGLVTIMAQGPTSGTSVYPLWQRALFSCYALFEYITKLLLPLNLNYLYPFPMDPGEAIPVRFWIYPLLLSGVACLVFIYRRNRIFMFGVLFFIIHLALSLNIVALGRYAMIADRYLYVGEVGLFLILANLFVPLYEKWKKQKKQYLAIPVMLYLCYLGGYTFDYTKQWKDSDTMKQYLKNFVDKATEKEIEEEQTDETDR